MIAVARFAHHLEARMSIQDVFDQFEYRWKIVGNKNTDIMFRGAD
jgi:hypothetical protein